MRKRSRRGRAAAFLTCACLLLPALAAGAQSGRNREKPPRTAPPPATPAPAGAPAAAPPAAADAEPGTAPRPVPPELRVARQDDDGATTRFVLRNGLTLVVAENHAIPAAAISALVRAGDADDPPGREGLAALAGRSALRAAGGRVRELGGDAGVETTADATLLSAVVPKASVSAALGAQIAALLAPGPDAAALRAEQAAASRAPYESPAALGRRRALEVAFAADPIRRTGAPLPDAARAVTPEDVAAFRRARYTPASTVLAVAGDVAVFDVLADVQAAYAGRPAAPEGPGPQPAPAGHRPARGARATPAAPGPAPAPVARPAEPDQTALRYALDRVDAGQAVVTVSYRAPALTAQGAAVPRMIAAALGQGRASRLARALRAQGLASAVDADYVATRGAGALRVQVAVDPKQIDLAEAALFREVDRFRRELLPDGELQRARNLVEKASVERSARLDGAARELATSEAFLGDFRAALRPAAPGRAVTAEDLQKAAGSMLAAGRATVHELVPPQAPARTFTPEQFAATVSSWAPTAPRPVAAGDVRLAPDVPEAAEGEERGRQGVLGDAVLSPLPLPVRDFSTLNGPHAFVREDQSRPTVAIALFFGAGRLTEAPEEAGVTELMLRSMLRQTRGGADRVAEIEQLGGEITVVDEPDFFGLVVDVLSRNADGAMGALIDLVEHPLLEKVDIDRERDIMLAELRAAADRPGREVELFWKGRYPSHPYGRSAAGAPDALAKLSVEQVRARYRATVQAQFPLVGVAGDTDGSSLISRHVAEGFERDEALAAVSVPTPEAPRGETEASETRDRRVTAQAVGFDTPGGISPGTEALDVAAEVASARVGRELVESRAVAQEARAVAEHRRFAGAVIATLVSPPADEQRAREALVAELGRLSAQAPAAAEVQAARDVVAVREGVLLQSHLARVVAYGRALYLGAPADWVDTRAARLRAVTPETLRTVAAATFAGGRTGRGVVRGR